MLKKKVAFNFENAIPELVVWRDVGTLEPDWNELEDLDEQMVVGENKTVGFVAKENDEVIVIVQTIDSVDEVLDGLVIPKGLIKNRKKIK